MFSINGFNYVIDTNRVPHAIVGNNNVSPLATDVTVESGHPVPQLHVHAQRPDLRVHRGRVAQPAGDHRHQELHDRAAGADLQARLEPGLHASHDAAGGGQLRRDRRADRHRDAPARRVLNLYAGTPESGNADFFMYKNVLYTLVKSAGVYVAVQKSYTVYAAKPAAPSSSWLCST